MRKIFVKKFFIWMGLSILIGASSWTFFYFRHFRDLVAFSDFKGEFDVQEIESTYKTHIQPILEQKCFQCHTDTQNRPFFYYIPFVNKITKPYVENQIRKGREQFDFSKGLPSENLGMMMEKIIALRDVVASDTMPPKEYRWARPNHMINDQEKNMILAWSQKASLVLENQMIGGTTEGGALPSEAEEADFGKELAESLMAASPLGDPGDKNARDLAAENLAKNKILQARMNEPFLWGGQKAPNNFNIYDAHLTRFNTLVWRKLYLSLFMFQGTYEVVKTGDATAYIFPIKFRGRLGDGEYPYPFWHTASKWQKYNEAKSVIFLVKNGKIIAAFRSADKQKEIPAYAKRVWDGKFRWFDKQNDVMQPQVTNFKALFSKSNPYIPDLEKTYHQLALGFRAENCLVCHSPDNKGGMEMLELLSSPVHALEARARVVKILEKDAMPPLDGIKDHEVKQTFLEWAKEFKEIGDKALKYENEPVNMEPDINPGLKTGVSSRDTF